MRKFGKFTVPDFIGDRYYSQTARTVAVICAILVSFTYIAGQMRGVGVVFSRFLEVDITTGVLIGMAMVYFYTLLGGMKGITYTQVAQYCILAFAYTVPAVFITMQMTGHFLPQTGFGATLADGSGQYLLERLDGLSTQLGFAEYTAGTKSGIDVFAITMALMVGTAGLPHVIIRFFTVPKVSDARRSGGWALVFIAVVYTTAPAIASITKTNIIGTINGPDQQGVLYENAPSWITN
ncbi:VC_2705 family sodium/solute symporter, partial [Arsukibacterium sp. MJ3]|uniref:VC_2705 family sodium/solute symporter n=1 Tax=Arsukibacterium sp. MJ3 TaxID=1632859 RepID=UPI0035105C37